MATADEIFVMTTEEPHIVIDSDRTIKIPNSLKRLAVQHDHNIETVTFDCPRYWDDHDMSKMAVYINYMLSDGYTDSYPVDNVTVDGDIMHFTWTISRNVTHVSGVINFLVCVKNTDAEGNEVNHWNSELCQDAYISKGMENEEIEALEQTDLITSLLLRMDSVEKINIKADEMQALLEETQAVAVAAEEVKNEALDASNYIKNSYANAIKGNASGETTRVDDVSPIEHTAKVNVHGKNLIPYPYFDGTSKTKNGITFTTNTDGSITVSGTATDTATFYIMRDYTRITGDVFLQGCVAGGSYSGYSLRLNKIIDGKEVTGGVDIGRGVKINIEENARILIYFVVLKETTMNETIYPMLSYTDTVTEYESYIDPSTVTVSRCEKNLFDINAFTSYSNINYAQNSVAVSDNTATLTSNVGSGFYVPLRLFANKPYIFKGNFTNITNIRIYKGETFEAEDTVAWIVNDFQESGNFEIEYTPTENGLFNLRFWIDNTTATVKNVMVCDAESTTTDYEAYNGESYTPDQNGDVAVTSVSPTMTLFTDTDGITIDLEYNRDTNKAFAELIEMINSK